MKITCLIVSRCQVYKTGIK